MSIRPISDAVLRDKSIYVLPSSSAAGSGNDDPFPAPPSSESIYRDDSIRQSASTGSLLAYMGFVDLNVW